MGTPYRRATGPPLKGSLLHAAAHRILALPDQTAARDVVSHRHIFTLRRAIKGSRYLFGGRKAPQIAAKGQSCGGLHAYRWRPA